MLMEDNIKILFLLTKMIYVSLSTIPSRINTIK